jgi:hypothetical protein
MARRTNWTEWNDWLTENYSKLSAHEIQERIGCSMSAIRQQANRLDLVKFPDDISFFENWTPESAYIIGLWAADGYANVRPGKGVAISISQTGELPMLERIQKLVGRGKLYYIWQNGSHRWELHSRKTYEFLCDLFGHDVKAKSKTLQWPNIAPEFERDFIRGYCDGDAHLGLDSDGYAQVRFSTGSIDFRNALVDKVSGLTGIEANAHTDNVGVNLALYLGIKGICLAHWLYRDGGLALERKIEMARNLASQEQEHIRKESLTPKMQEMFPDILDRYWKQAGQRLVAPRKHGTHAGWIPRPELEQMEFVF